MNVFTSFLQESNQIEVFSSSIVEECPVNNWWKSNRNLIWWSDESLPQFIWFDLSKMNNRPTIVRGVGIYCWHAYNTNPKVIELLISKSDKSFISLGNFELSFSAGTQVVSTDEIIFNDINYMKIVIKETFGGERTYWNKVYLYEEIPQNENVVSIHDSRERNLPLTSVSIRKITKENSREIDKDNSNAKGLIIKGNEVWMSDSDYSEKRGAKVQSLIKENNHNKLHKIHETSIDLGSPKNNKNSKINIVDTADEEAHLIRGEPQIPNITYWNNEQIANNHNGNNKVGLEQYILTTSNDNLNYLNNNNLISYNNNQNEEWNSNNNNKFEYFDKRIQNIESEIDTIKQKVEFISNHVENWTNSLSQANSHNSQYNNFRKNNKYILNKCNQLLETKISSLISHYKDDAAEDEDISHVQNQMNKYNNNNNITNKYSKKQWMKSKKDSQINSLNSSVISNNVNTSNNLNLNENEEDVNNKQYQHKLSQYTQFDNNNNNTFFERALNQKLEEKFNCFTEHLQERIYSSLLKPTLDNWESNLQTNLREIKKQLNYAARVQKTSKKDFTDNNSKPLKYSTTEKKKSHIKNKNNSTKKYHRSDDETDNYQNEIQVSEWITKLNQKLDDKYIKTWNEFENSKIFNSSGNKNNSINNKHYNKSSKYY